MKSKYIILFLIVNFSFGQAIKQDKPIRASMVYGYFTGIETALATISETNPNFRKELAVYLKQILHQKKFTLQKANLMLIR